MTDESNPAAVAQEKADETKRKFREALERKKQQGDNHVVAPGAESAIHGVHGKAGNKRQFRRKSS